MEHPFDAITLASLRRRHSAKWSRYAPDVLPAWVAEMDYPLATPIRAALHAAVEADDCGYADPDGLGRGVRAVGRARCGAGTVAPRDVRVVPDVVTGLDRAAAG
jgi:cystathionine beta-lyase